MSNMYKNDRVLIFFQIKDILYTIIEALYKDDVSPLTTVTDV